MFPYNAQTWQPWQDTQAVATGFCSNDAFLNKKRNMKVRPLVFLSYMMHSQILNDI